MYSQDLRDRIIGEVRKGSSARSAAAKFGVSVNCAIKMVKRWRETGSVEPGRTGRVAGVSVLSPHRDWLLETVDKEPDATLEDLRRRLKDKGVDVAAGTIWYFLDGCDYSYKKKPVRVGAGQAGRKRGKRAVAGKSAKT
jgi:putative transposase